MSGFSVKNFAIDPKAEVEGVWFDVNGLRLRVARMSSPAFSNWARRNLRVSANSRVGGAPGAANSQMATGVAQHLLLGWENLTDDSSGTEVVVEYSPATAEVLLRKYPEFLRLVLECAQDHEAFRLEDVETARGNSSKQ